jgi:hypothetical protein
LVVLISTLMSMLHGPGMKSSTTLNQVMFKEHQTLLRWALGVSIWRISSTLPANKDLSMLLEKCAMKARKVFGSKQQRSWPKITLKLLKLSLETHSNQRKQRSSLRESPRSSDAMYLILDTRIWSMRSRCWGLALKKVLM